MDRLLLKEVLQNGELLEGTKHQQIVSERHYRICRQIFKGSTQQHIVLLVKEQLTSNLPPFTDVGVDYFGQISVRFRRLTVKRWGGIFTCLASRAVHVEIAHGMTAASFISAFQRFTSHRVVRV